MTTAHQNNHENCQLSIANYQLLLRKYWGYNDFRGIQKDIIESIGGGHDTLGLMPTGGGKSICFQVPAMAMEGVCLVITPLIALMKDQVHHLHQHGIFAAAVHSSMSHDDILRTLDNCILGRTKFLYVSPERLSSELFVTKLRHMKVCFITVDEAHCISQWGYDFRPAYLEIARIRTILPAAPVLALTATATPMVVEDICNKLSFPDQSGKTAQDSAVNDSGFRVFRMSFERKNLTYTVRNVPDKLHELVHILQQVPGAAIVYVRSRRHAKEIATYLGEAGLSATFYHAGLEPQQKDQRQRDWQHDRVRIIVATNAFGMGIDKADVRLVVHYDCPDSIEAYFQEAGRAGRDGQQARAVMLYNTSDNGKLSKRIDETFPPREYIRQVYEHLAYYYQIAVGDGFGVTREFNIDEFCHRFHHFPVRVHAALQILQRAGYIDYDEAPDMQARVHFLLERHELYRLQENSPAEERVIVTLLRSYGGLFADYGFIDEAFVAKQCGMKTTEVYEILKQLSQKHIIHFIPRRQIPTIRYCQRREDAEHVRLTKDVYDDRLAQYRQRIQAMLHYMQSNDKCRSRLLLEYFGEKTANDCGQCDICLAQQGATVSKADRQQARQKILTLLADRQQHHITQLRQLPLPSEAIDAALAELIAEEVIYQKDGFLVTNSA